MFAPYSLRQGDLLFPASFCKISQPQGSFKTFFLFTVHLFFIALCIFPNFILRQLRDMGKRPASTSASILKPALKLLYTKAANCSLPLFTDHGSIMLHELRQTSLSSSFTAYCR